MNDIISFLDDALRVHDPDPPSVSRWLSSIGDSPRCQQLAACIGIDLLVGSILHETIAKIISQAERNNTGVASASDAFQEALNHVPHANLLCTCVLESREPFNGKYYRVLDSLDFVTYYDPYRSASHKTHRKILQLYPDGMKLGFVTQPFRGALPIVWVTSDGEMNNLLSSDGSSTTIAAHRLGLTQSSNSLGEPSQFFAIEYPSPPPMTGHKPTVFDQRWNATHRYVSSHRSSTWGVTLPIPPESTGANEHVHHELSSGLTDDFTLRHLGIQPLPTEQTSVAQAAIERFRDALEWSVGSNGRT